MESSQPVPIATWNPARTVWETAQDMLCGHSALYSETLPSSGTMRSGRLYPPQTPEAATSASASSSSPGLLPTPNSSDHKGSNVPEGRLRKSGRPRTAADGDLPAAVERVGLLPTPAAGNFNDGESVESWEARRQANLAKGVNGNGQGTPLGIALQLLKTPTAQLAVNGGSQHPVKRRAGGHGPTLADQAEHELLPTPTASLEHPPAPWKPGVQWWLQSRAARNLAALENLLPTPQVADVTGGHRTRSGARSNELLLPGVADVVAGGLLPTPRAIDGRPKGNGPRPDTLTGFWHYDGRERVTEIAVVDWGKYARAVLRWQQVTGVMVPHPLVPGKNKPVLSPVFVEWMMGLDEGWVTAVPGLSRNAQLKILGNGVVPQQAVLALNVLFGRLA